MLFKPHHSLFLLQGKLATHAGRPVVVDLDGASYGIDEIAFAIPDDEPQSAELQTAGFQVHTPMSMHLGEGATGG